MDVCSFALHTSVSSAYSAAATNRMYARAAKRKKVAVFVPFRSRCTSSQHSGTKVS